MALSATQRAPVFTERQLVGAVRAGDDRAFEELYSRYRGQIGGYIHSRVRDHARAEDVAQEVFISALRRLRESKRPIAFKPWIYEIAKNACIDEYRRTCRAHEVPLGVGSVAEADADGTADSARELPSSGPTPDAAVESKQSLADLQGAFHGLSESHHQIIVMRELEGLSYSQIGERLGMTRPVVESTLFRARRKLSEEYDELASGRRCLHVQQLIDTTTERALRKVGIRQRRQLARHLSHCQPCRRHARMAGLDEGFFSAPSVIGKIAALLPFPWLRWRRGSSRNDTSAADSPSHSFFALRSFDAVARFVAPLTAAAATPRGAAAAAATLALAGAGGGVVTAVTSQSPPPSRALGHGAPATNSRSASRVRASVSSMPVLGPSARAAPASRRSRKSNVRHSGRSSAPASSATSASPPSGSSGSGSTGGKVLSGVTGVASGTTQKVTGIQAPNVPAASKLPGSIGSAVPKAPKVSLPKPPKLLPSGSAGGSSSSGSTQVKVPGLPTVTVPSLPQPPDPDKLLP